MKECLSSSSTGQPRRDMLNARAHTYKHKDKDLSLPRQARESDRERRGKRKAEGKRERDLVVIRIRTIDRINEIRLSLQQVQQPRDKGRKYKEVGDGRRQASEATSTTLVA